MKDKTVTRKQIEQGDSVALEIATENGIQGRSGTVVAMLEHGKLAKVELDGPVPGVMVYADIKKLDPITAKTKGKKKKR